MSCASNTLLLSCRPVLIMAGLPDDAKGHLQLSTGCRVLVLTGQQAAVGACTA